DALQDGDHARSPRGSRASRRVSPRMLNEKVTRNSAAAGNSRKAGSTSSQAIASPIERPQEGVGGSTPTPRKDRVASALIRPGSEMQEYTITVEATLGRTWWRDTCRKRAPITREANTYG